MNQIRLHGRVSFPTGRLEAFSDGVFAIAITLLVLDLVVPEPSQLDGNSLARELVREWPSYFAYLVSFLVIGIIWMNHHALCTLLRRVDRPVLFANLFLLLTVSVIPFPTRLLAAYLTAGDANAHVAAAVYSGAMLLLGVAFSVLFVVIVRDARLLHVPLVARCRSRRPTSLQRWRGVLPRSHRTLVRQPRGHPGACTPHWPSTTRSISWLHCERHRAGSDRCDFGRSESAKGFSPVRLPAGRGPVGAVEHTSEAATRMRRTVAPFLTFAGGFLIAAAIVLAWVPGRSRGRRSTPTTRRTSPARRRSRAAPTWSSSRPTCSASAPQIDGEPPTTTYAVWATSLCLVGTRATSRAASTPRPRGPPDHRRDRRLRDGPAHRHDARRPGLPPGGRHPGGGPAEQVALRRPEEDLPHLGRPARHAVDATYEGTEDFDGMETYLYRRRRAR